MKPFAQDRQQWIFLFIFGALVVMKSPAFATSLDSTTLTESQVIEFALENNEQLKLFNTNVEIAKHRYQSSGWISNPEVRLGKDIQESFAEKYGELETGLRWRLPGLGELGEKKLQARVELWKNKVATIRYKHELLAKVRKDFADVIMYDHLVKLDSQNVAKEKERLNMIQQMVDLGTASIVRLTKTQLASARAKNHQVRTIQKQGQARRNLSVRAGIPENAHLIGDDLPEVTQELDTLINRAFSSRPEITLVQQRVKLASQQENLEKYKLIPWLSFVEFSYHIDRNQNENWKEMMVGINLPLFNWNQGYIRATKLAAQNKQREFNAIQETIAEEVRSAYFIYLDLRLDWQNYSDTADELIKNMQSVVEKANQHQTLLPDEVLEMELAVIETRKLVIEKKRNLTHALIDLSYAIGTENYEKLSRQPELK